MVDRLTREQVLRNPANAPTGAAANPNGTWWDRERWYYYDNANVAAAPPAAAGLVTLRRDWLFVGGVLQTIDTGAAYDAYGNKTAESAYNAYGMENGLAPTTDPRTTAWTYHATYAGYRTSETKGAQLAPGSQLTTSWDYDFVLSRLKTETDPNGQQTWHAYDPLGRRTATWLPGDDHTVPGAATTTYRYLVGAGPTRLQVGRRTDTGGTHGRRAYEWRFFDGLGRLVQTQREFDRSMARVQAQDVNDLRTAIVARNGTTTCPAVTAGATRVAASHFVALANDIAAGWNTPVLGQFQAWSSGLPPGGPSMGTTPTPVYMSDLVDLRLWLNADQASRGQAQTGRPTATTRAGGRCCARTRRTASRCSRCRRGTTGWTGRRGWATPAARW